MSKRRGYIFVRGLEPPAVENLLTGYLSVQGYRPPDEGEVAGGPESRGFQCSRPLGEWAILVEKPGHHADSELANYLSREGRAETVWIEFDPEGPLLEAQVYQEGNLRFSGREEEKAETQLEELVEWLNIPSVNQSSLGVAFHRIFLRERRRGDGEDVLEIISRLLRAHSPGFRHAEGGLFQAPLEEGLWGSLLFDDWREARILYSHSPEVGNYQRRADVVHFESPRHALREASPLMASIFGPKPPNPPQGLLRFEDAPARVQSYLTAYIPYCLKVMLRILPHARRTLKG